MQAGKVYKCVNINDFNSLFYKELLEGQYLEVSSMEDINISGKKGKKIKFDILESDFNYITPQSGLNVEITLDKYNVLKTLLEEIN